MRTDKTMVSGMKFAPVTALLAGTALAVAAAEPQFRIQGFGWVQTGMVMNATDTLRFNFNNNWMQSAATQVTADVILDEHWDGSLGIGAGQEHRMQGRVQDARLLHMDIATYITQARFTYTRGEREKPAFSATFGMFPYIYNTDVKNLGLYLLRGPVYPGALVSGFETKETLPIASFLGSRLHANLGPTSHDLLLFSETENKPLFDYSLAYIFRHSLGEVFSYGAGVNFYHLLPVYDWVTHPEKGKKKLTFTPDEDVDEPLDRLYFHVDPANPADTTWMSHQGTKVAGFFRFDPKPLFGLAGGRPDWSFYLEAALLGVRNYKGIYPDRKQRLPVMAGLNFPTFGLLDNLTLEVEYYSSPYKNDLKEVSTNFSPTPISNRTNQYKDTTLAVGYVTKAGDTLTAPRTVVAVGSQVFEDVPWGDPYDMASLHKDDWKWSLHAAKTILGHIRFSAQVANDHFRPGGTGTTPTYFSIFSTMDDWYWMTKLTYFF